MQPEPDFVSWVANAYEHLYDLVYLRTQALVGMLGGPPDQASAESLKKRARQLHQILLDGVADLDPGPQAPAFSAEWRRHRLMALRYVKGLPPQAVADQLGVSLRHYYRLHDSAVADVAGMLWPRLARQKGQPPAEAGHPDDETSHLVMLRLEAARLAQADRSAHLGEVISGVLTLLRDVIRQHRLEVKIAIQPDLPAVPVGQSLLRQQLLGILGYLIERAEDAAVCIAADADAEAVFLTAAIDPPGALRGGAPRGTEAEAAEELRLAAEQLAGIGEIARLTGAPVTPLHAGAFPAGFEVQFPVADRAVLVVDDNEDILELFRRYLTPHRYRVITTHTADEALASVAEIRPLAITLDLMMPQQDGWDLMQVLLNRPDTHRIPIIVCSVLKQRELALSLGATAFLEKPVTEAALVSALEALVEP